MRHDNKCTQSITDYQQSTYARIPPTQHGDNHALMCFSNKRQELQDGKHTLCIHCDSSGIIKPSCSARAVIRSDWAVPCECRDHAWQISTTREMKIIQMLERCKSLSKKHIHIHKTTAFTSLHFNALHEIIQSSTHITQALRSHQGAWMIAACTAHDGSSLLRVTWRCDLAD